MTFEPWSHRFADLSDFASGKKETAKHWTNFWQTGGAIDLSGSKDPRWFELERRIVLSQYLTAIQDAGSNPPQETGLTYNTWEGKFHLEMHFWHEAHFALWDRLPLLERSVDYYNKILPRAEGTAKKQGFAGARWPKMTSPSGAESPSPVGPFLVWQEPHPNLLRGTRLPPARRQSHARKIQRHRFPNRRFHGQLSRVGRKNETLRPRPHATNRPGNFPQRQNFQPHV